MLASKTNRILVVLFALWAVMHTFAHFIHPIEGTANYITELLYKTSVYAPSIMLLALVADHYGKQNRKVFPKFIMRWLNSYRLWMILYTVGLIAVSLFIIWTQILGHYICYRGLITPLGMLIIVAMFMLHNFKDKIGVWQAACVGMMSVGFVIGGWELPYQALSYSLRVAGWSNPLATQENFIIIMTEQLRYVVPLLIVCPVLGLRPTKWTVVCFGLFALLWSVWYLVFDFWSVVIWSNERQELLLNTPIRWGVYHIVKAGQVFFILGVASLKLRPALNAAYDWQGFNSCNPLRKWWKNKLAQRVWLLAKNINNNPKVLDIGCGSSRIITKYKRAIGIDNDPDKIKYMRQKGKGDFRVMDAHSLDFDHRRFNLVLCIEVIEHLKSPDKALSEISRVLSDGGYAIISTPDNQKLLWRVIQPIYDIAGGYSGQHTSLLTKDKLVKLAERNNLLLEHCEYVAGCDLVCVFKKGKLCGTSC